MIKCNMHLICYIKYHVSQNKNSQNRLHNKFTYNTFPNLNHELIICKACLIRSLPTLVSRFSKDEIALFVMNIMSFSLAAVFLEDRVFCKDLKILLDSLMLQKS